MGLCENVYRRGAVYWWRRRGRARPDAAGRYLHISLKVRHPRQARALARLVGVEADRLETIEMLDASQQRALLKAFVEHHLGHFDAVAASFVHRDIASRSTAEPTADRIRRDKSLAAVYAALGARGVAADIGDAEAAKLRGAGFDDEAIEDVREKVVSLRDRLPRFADDGTLSEWGPEGLLGPANTTFREALRLLEADQSDAAVEQARRLWLQAMSVVIGDTERRHRILDVSEAEALYREILGAPQRAVEARPPHEADAASPATAQCTAAAPSPAAVPSAAAVDASDDGATPDWKPEKQDFTISGQIRSMVDAKKGVDWKITKRGDQEVSDIAETYIFLARLIVKMLGVDDVRRLDSRLPMELRKRLQNLPKAYGKAPKDWDLSFDEAIAKAERDGKPIGRTATTINKYLNCLQSFLRFVAASGIPVANTEDQVKGAKPKVKKPKANTLRAAFTDDDYRALFSDEEWTGPAVLHDSTYWVPLMTRYGGGRLEEPCGLLIEEVDFASPIPSYVIRANKVRTIKSESRRVPFHSELLRLGIRDYCEAIKAHGHEVFFPDLPARGRKTSIGSLLSKKFTPILDRALPSARSNKQTQHSARKTLNTELRDEGIDITIRCEILGHAQEGVNASVYTDPARDNLKRKAIETIANVTADVPRRPISLSPLVTGEKIIRERKRRQPKP